MGVAAEGWNFCVLAQRGDRVCPLVMALESRKIWIFGLLLNTLSLQARSLAWRRHAGQMVLDLIASVGTVDQTHRVYIQAAELLLEAGAVLPGSCDRLQPIAAQPMHFAMAPDARRLRLAKDRSILRLSVISDNVQASALGMLVLSHDFRESGAQGFLKAIAQDAPCALAHREAPNSDFPGASILHACVWGDCLPALLGVLALYGDELLEAMDASDRTAPALAEEIEHHSCASVLRAYNCRVSALHAIKELSSFV